MGVFYCLTAFKRLKKYVISFLSNEKGNYDIFHYRYGGEKFYNVLTTDAMRKSALTCSPNGYLFAFTSNENGNPDIYKMDIRNRKSIQLTQHPEKDIRPAWSPNGKMDYLCFPIERELKIFIEWMWTVLT